MIIVGLTPRWSHLSELGTSEKNFALVCRAEGRRPRMRAASESTGPIDNRVKRMNDLQKALLLEFMDDLSYTTIIEPAESPASRRGSALDR